MIWFDVHNWNKPIIYWIDFHHWKRAIWNKVIMWFMMRFVFHIRYAADVRQVGKGFLEICISIANCKFSLRITSITRIKPIYDVHAMDDFSERTKARFIQFAGIVSQ